jgi:DNA repair exonuclease SbcCD ATPase subunit
MINGDLVKQIEEYCELNNIPDTNKYINQLLRDGFNVAKYGSGPFTSQPQEKIVEKEVIKTVEVPVEVEVIKEVRVEVEVPVEVEKIVEKEKITYISDDTKINELLDKIKKLENDGVEQENKKQQEIETLQSSIKSIQTDFGIKEQEYKDLIEEKNKNETLLKEKVEELQNIKNESKKDIYGENRGGYSFGSNLMD